MRTIYLIVIIYTIVYFVGLAWYDLVHMLYEGNREAVENGTTNQSYFYKENFMKYVEIDDHKTILIASCYFSFTSLSTVGFGDYAPLSDVERLVCAMILFCGVIIFTYICGVFTGILNDFIALNADLDDGDNLSKFFGIV